MTNTKKAFWVTFTFVVAASPLALADNVVVTPQPAAPAQAQPAPVQPTQVNVQPAPAAQAAEPVVDQQPRKTVHTNVEPSRNYMSTVAVSAIMGAVAGALVGGAIYYLDDAPRDNPHHIGYWAAGGVLLGVGVGVTQVMVQEGRASDAVALNRLPRDPAPTVKVALFRAQF